MRRRQIILVQVVKEERGNKGAALTTYISLAGRFCVLMPNSPRGGGVSRKITSAADRRRLKEITAELEIPRGMGMIVRTAGAQRPRPEIRRDCEYLLRTWDDIRETTLASTAPCLVYEEASLIKRAIRDVYTRDVEEIVVDGEPGWRAAREFMRTLMPSNANKVNLWRDGAQTLFSAHGVEHHLDAMLLPTVQLRSGGYLVINQTEALVAIDVNSGRSTRERGIEETAFRTNVEAADEVARQLRLRDLAGLIVIDFIDMEVSRNNATVERRLKDALRNDRARIQVGSISHFGLLEMSRQRLRPSLAESSFVPCSHCAGSGFMRGTESSALHVLRAIEEEAGRRKAAEILVHAAGSVALYVLNNKRAWLSEIESRHRIAVHLAADDSLIPPALRIDRVRPFVAAPEPVEPAAIVTHIPIRAEPRPSPRPTPLRWTRRQTTSRMSLTRRRPPAPPARPRATRPGAAASAAAAAAAADARTAPPRQAEPRMNPVRTRMARNRKSRSRRRARCLRTRRRSTRRRRMGMPRLHRLRPRPARADAAAVAADGRVRTWIRVSPTRAWTPPRTRMPPARRAPYVGPTPADPFAGSFDIFEMIEREAEETQGLATDPSASAASLAPPAPAPEPVAEVLVPAQHLTQHPMPRLMPGPRPHRASRRCCRCRKKRWCRRRRPWPSRWSLPSARPRRRRPGFLPRPCRKRRSTPCPIRWRCRTSRRPRPHACRSRASRARAGPRSHPWRMPPPSRQTRQRSIPKPHSRKRRRPSRLPPCPNLKQRYRRRSGAPEPAAPEAVSAAEPDASVQARDPSIVQPVVIGDATPAPARRTGWWKR